jgi:ArsR family transcriptional regulator
MDLAATEGTLSLLGDPTRVRLLSLLAETELTVAELCAVTGLAQSRVSTHLGRLRDGGVVCDRRAGSSTFYRLNAGAMPLEARAVWDVLRARVDDPLLEADRARGAEVVRARDGAGWPDAIAGQMERHYSPGRTWESLARAFLGLVSLGDVLDVGAGDGTVAELLAPRAKSITCIDRSEKLVAAASARLGSLKGARAVHGDMHELPFERASFDQVLMLNVLQYTKDHEGALAEAARVLRPGGVLVVTTLAHHRHHEITDAYGHVSRGLTAAALERALEAAGLDVDFCDVTSRERRKPHFRVMTAFARKPER